MRITVLRGGPSSEREVSLISGKSVADGLRAAGHEVFESDIDPEHLQGLDRPCDVIFPVLHGRFGESGELQQLLESRGIPFVGSGSAASRLGIDKHASKRAWQRAGLPVPCGILASDMTVELFAPCVVKPVDGGSSIDVEICKDVDRARAACERLLQKYPQLLVEAFIEGNEITVGILGEQPLPPIRISTSHQFFDYSAKYAGGAEHHFDLNLPDDVADQLKSLAWRAHESLGCRDLSRVDFIVDRQQRPYLLEINTMPGFTPRSLLPEAAAQVGIAFPDLVDRLVRAAHARSAERPSVTVQLNPRLGHATKPAEALQSDAAIVR
jgi:D-alanine-D-alanine ligase